jgi:hypothetical protein
MKISYKKYIKLVSDRFPELNFDKDINISKVKCLRIVSMILFTLHECDTELAKITREKIQEYWKNGHIKDF